MKKLLIFAGVLLLIGGGCFQENTTPVTVNVSDRVTVGEEFDITVQIPNDTNDDMFLHSIDIGNSYLQGVTVYDSDPLFSDYYDLTFEDMTSFTLETDVPAQTIGEVVFHARAYEPGAWLGGFDVCFKKGADCVFMHISTVVEEEGKEVLEQDIDKDQAQE